MNYKIDFRNLNNNEKELTENYIKENFDDLNLHLGYNYAIDVTDAIGRTANVDIYVA